MSDDEAELVAPPVILWEPVIDKTPVLLHMPDVGAIAPPVVLSEPDDANQQSDAFAPAYEPSSGQSGDGLPSARGKP